MAQTRWGREGFGAGAHSGHVEKLSGLGEGRKTMNLTVAIVGAEVDDEGDCNVLGPPVSYNSVERTRTLRRSSRARQRGEEEEVVAAMTSGCDGCARAREGERE